MSDVIEIESSDEEGFSSHRKATLNSVKTFSKTDTNQNMNKKVISQQMGNLSSIKSAQPNTLIIRPATQSLLKRGNSTDGQNEKKRIKTTHVSSNVSPNLRVLVQKPQTTILGSPKIMNQIQIGNVVSLSNQQKVSVSGIKPIVNNAKVRVGEKPKTFGDETLMVFNTKTKNIVYQKEIPIEKPSPPKPELTISEVRSIASAQSFSSQDPLKIPEPVIPSTNPTKLGKFAEVTISPVVSNLSSKTPSSSIPSTISKPSNKTVTSENGYTSTPEVSLRPVNRINSPVPGSSRASSMSSPGAASTSSGLNGSVSETAPIVVKKPAPEINDTFKELLEACKAADQSKEMGIIEKKLIKYYHGVHRDFVNSVSFKRNVEKATADIKSQPSQVFLLLKNIVEELKIRQGAIEVTEDGEIITEVDENMTEDPKINKKLYKLNRSLLIIQKKIKKLQEVETNWEDEANSSYLIIDRFEKRAVKIYEMICQLTGEKTNAYRRVKKPIKFKKTSFPEFNKALQSFYNKTHNFPDFYDVLKILDYCNTTYDYGLNKDRLKSVAQEAFQDLGETLQGLRKNEEYETLSYYTDLARNAGIDIAVDPAENDEELARKLEENKKHHSRIDLVIKLCAEDRRNELEELIYGKDVKSKRGDSDSDASTDSGNDEAIIEEPDLNGSTSLKIEEEEDEKEESEKQENGEESHDQIQEIPKISCKNEITIEPEIITLDDVDLLEPSTVEHTKPS
uniref:CSON001651 protein n=1 Tax=Culicoides sonorensis TaxID=179676 RepID=A0A336MIA7_CULSO